MKNVKIKHTIHIGDSREVLKGIDKDSINLVVTSPPYNVGKNYSSNYDNGMKYQKYWSLLKDVFKKVYRILKPHSFICVNIGREMGINTPAHLGWILEQCGFLYQHLIIWKKPSGAAIQTFTKGQFPYSRYYMPKIVTEQILMYSKDQINKFRGERKEENKLDNNDLKECETNIWEMNPSGESEHPAPFPLRLPLNCIKFYSRIGETVLDPFLGSGTTTKAANILNRNSIGIELEKKYLPLIKKTIEYNQQKLNSEVEYEIKINK